MKVIYFTKKIVSLMIQSILCRNTSELRYDTSATPVQHKCNTTSSIRERHEQRDWKNFDFDNGTSENIFFS